MNTGEWFDPSSLERLERMVGASVSREIVSLFLDNAPQQISAGRAGDAAGELDAVMRSAHSLKSSAANLGAREVERIATALEQLARQGERERIPSLLGDLEAAYQRVEQVLQRRMA